MLEEVRINSLGVIDEAILTFTPGLTVVTGETGAGKTMVLNGIGMLLGGKTDAKVVRDGTAKATSDGTFVVSATSPAALRAVEAGGHLDDVIDTDTAEHSVELLVGRQVSANGRSRAFCGGKTVPVAVLNEVAAQLVTVHGQTDQLALKSAAKQRALLDRFGGTLSADILGKYQTKWRTYQEAQAQLADLKDSAQARVAEAERLRRGAELIESLDPAPGEIAELKNLIARMGSVEELRSMASHAYAALVGEDHRMDGPNAVTCLAEAVHGISRSEDPALQELTTRVQSAMYQAQDAAQDLASYLADLSVDPEKMAQSQQRLAELNRLIPTYGNDLQEVLKWAQEAAQRLTVLDNDPQAIERLSAHCEALRAELVVSALELHKRRVVCAEALGAAVSEELTRLAMPAAQLSVQVTHQEQLGAHGADTVELLLAAHSGTKPAKLKDGASGGELSRVMLAIEVVVGAGATEHTFIFDEVDAGVGGAAANEIGFRLAALAQTAQVIVVTHLPQVAAFADNQLVVRKNDDGTSTSTTVTAVTGPDRVKELARMLAGSAESDTARNHAQELLDNATDRVSELGHSSDTLSIHGQPWITSLQ